MASATVRPELLEDMANLMMDVITKHPKTAKEAYALFQYFAENAMKPAIEKLFEKMVLNLPAEEAQALILLHRVEKDMVSWCCLPRSK
jgi:hypothetical protein